MNEWSENRKRIILAIAVSILVVLIGLPVFFFVHRTPTCSDGKLNGDETGVDCGGSCQRLCTPEALPLLSHGDAKILEVASSTYEVVAVVENPNVYGEVANAGYTIKLYDASSTSPLKIIEGTTYIPKSKTFTVFEGPFDLGDAVPYRAILEWRPETLVWNKNTDPVPDLVVSDKFLSGALTNPRVEARIKNNSLDNVSNIELVAVVSDQTGNTIAASKTYIDKLESGESAPIVFTWPNGFATSSAAVDISFRIFPDRSFLK